VVVWLSPLFSKVCDEAPVCGRPGHDVMAGDRPGAEQLESVDGAIVAKSMTDVALSWGATEGRRKEAANSLAGWALSEHDCPKTGPGAVLLQGLPYVSGVQR
jgi:hypothetical protein